MHELALAQEVVRRVERRAIEVGAAEVLQVTLRIGRMNQVNADSLGFYFDICKASTMAAQATLLVEDVAARAYCPSCRREFEPELPVAVCPDLHAGVEWLSGFELVIANMRIRDPEDEPCAEPVVAASQHRS